jgi:hypothetical protein
VGAVGAVSVLGMKELELHMMTDPKWGIEDQKKATVEDREKGIP